MRITWSSKVLAWGVHGFTASGLLIAFVCVIAIAQHDYRLALYCFLIALVVDAVDGTLARWAKVKVVLPNYDGKMLDWVSDFVNFCFLPAFLFYQIELVPQIWAWVCVIGILLSSAYHFGNKLAVTEEGYFRGFPAFWNIVVFYLILIPLNSLATIAVVALFFILHFVPIHFVYPTRIRNLRLIVWILSACTIISGFFAARYFDNNAEGISAPAIYWQLSLGSLVSLFLLGCYLSLVSHRKTYRVEIDGNTDANEN